MLASLATKHDLINFFGNCERQRFFYFPQRGNLKNRFFTDKPFGFKRGKRASVLPNMVLNFLINARCARKSQIVNSILFSREQRERITKHGLKFLDKCSLRSQMPKKLIQSCLVLVEKVGVFAKK